MQNLPILLLCLLAWRLTSCQPTKNNQSTALTNSDTTQIIQTVIDAFKPDWERTFEGQPMRILPNRFIRPGMTIKINGLPVTFSAIDSSGIDRRLTDPKFFATIEEFVFPTDSTAYVDISFRDIGDGGEFRLLRKRGTGWVIIKQQLYKI
ncbi:hypothetical protein [Larkinella soli]|uniref:hypothetical protein n=1 Tax=Larkinella soli TaxID=1770527 RepID=UPI000FFC45AA|nr:hypothetical protein [Larkinella soli]